MFAVSAKEKAFVKGNIAEKILILQNLDESEKIPIVQKGLDFSIENVSVLAQDEELNSLVLSCISALPDDASRIKKIKKKEQQKLSEKLMAIFKLFGDTKIKSASMEKLPLYSKADRQMLVEFLNDYLESAFKTGEKEENVLESAIVTVGQVGNENSLTVVFNIWHSKIWPAYQKSAGDALALLCHDSFSDIIKIFSISNIGEFEIFFSLLKNSLKNDTNSLCSVAENALLIAINNAEKLTASTEEKKAFVAFQIETQAVLAENKWSHASSVVNSNMLLLKKSYDEGLLSETDFIKMIESSVQVPSEDLAKTLTEMLSDCNSTVEKIDRIVVGDSDEKSTMPARNVVLALIKALGELGDKTAFDALLYVTYISYPLEVIDEAKMSLAKLNW